MSYILDALRKSADERRKRQAGNEVSYEPLAVDPRNLQNKRSSPLIVVISLISLGVVAMVGGWFLVSLQNGPASPTRNHIQVEKQDIVVSDQEQVTVPKPEPVADSGSVPPTVSDPPSVFAKKQPSTIDQPPPTPPGPESHTVKPAPQRIPLLQDLPFAQQAVIPDMKFSGHVYSSDPELRLVMVNTAVVREGETITPDIKLIEIVNDGLILQYRQSRFKIELF